MANTPRNLGEILESVQDTHRDIDPTIDITKGPISVLMYVFSAELTRTEQHSSYLSSVYQLEIADDLDDEDIENLGRNYGRDPDAGSVASVVLTFFRNNRPEAGNDYVLDEGTLVSTNDGRYIFVLQQQVRMNGNSADTYYNSTRRRYEVRGKAAAIAIGSDYNLPEQTIENILTDTVGFDGVINFSAAINGRDPIGKTAFRNMIWETIQGLDSDIVGYFGSTLLSTSATGIDDFSVVPSSDFQLFKRHPYLAEKTGYDIYIISDEMEEDIQSGTALGGETYLKLDKSPVLSVESVLVDGQPASFTFIPDSSEAFRGSPLGEDRVRLDIPLTTSQVYEIRYYYYSVVYDAWFQLGGRKAPFGTDVLTKHPFEVPVYIAGTLRLSAIFDRDEVINEMRLFTTSYLNDPITPSLTRRVFYTTLDPANYRDSVIENVGGVSGFDLTNFVRIDAAVRDIDVIEFDGATEYPIISEQFDVR